ncbi:hypothetical protein QJS10_CPA10g01484 [Acorus calamus]|uniref:Reverse transcriptase domain-containing protein n=1 Tax=Acorus calamus TaxID=4465 RepID=A0AAV9DXU6_ACOCL|nr:hypothetical protein QJS10_CPA10g01484 [Acorus calamus]
MSLIPKSKSVDSLDEFWPISLCNTVYKLITKTMVARIQVFLPRLINLHQSDFVKGRNIAHSILLAHELVRYLNTTTGVGRACIKIDLKKEFDSVCWPYLLVVLKGFNFPAHWCHMILNCVQTTAFSVLVNGSPKGFFNSSCGLRQDTSIENLHGKSPPILALLGRPTSDRLLQKGLPATATCTLCRQLPKSCSPAEPSVAVLPHFNDMVHLDGAQFSYLQEAIRTQDQGTPKDSSSHQASILG